MKDLQYFLSLDFSHLENSDGVVKMQDVRMQLMLAPLQIGVINKQKESVQEFEFQ